MRGRGYAEPGKLVVEGMDSGVSRQRLGERSGLADYLKTGHRDRRLGTGWFLRLSIASKSNDPVTLTQTVGTVAGAIGGLSLVMIIIGLIGKRV
jgi:hypothetical protein